MPEIVVCKDKDLKPGKMLAVKAGAQALLLFRDKAGKISCLENRCSHDEVPLSDGVFEDGVVECAAHGARFNCQTGEALCMPAVSAVRSFETKVIGENILVVMA